MAIGFTPHYTEDSSLYQLSPHEFLAVCDTAVRNLNWKVVYISDSGLIASTGKTLFKANQNITIRIFDDLANIRSESTGAEMMDLGRNKENVGLLTTVLAETVSAHTPEQWADIYNELKPNFVPPDQDILKGPPPTTAEKWGSFFSLFVPRQGYFITPILVDINLAIFVLMAISGAGLFAPSPQTLIGWGANIRYLTLEGQWWRLITCCFIHIGIFHVLLNMYALIYIGLLLEPQLGRRRFTAAYLLTGITASLGSLYWHENTVSAGASGAIFGMYGVFLALLTTNLIEKTRRQALLTSIGIFVAYNLLYGARGGVDNAAHIGGLIGGLVIGYIFYPGLRQPDSPRLLYSGIIGAALLVMVISLIGFKKIPNDYGMYQRKMVSFARYEKRALAVFNMNSDSSKELWMSRLQDSGIYNWNQCIRVLDEANELTLLNNLKERNDALIRYCNLRILYYNYFYKKFEGTAGHGEDSVPYYNAQISDLMDSLKRGIVGD